MSRCRMRPCKRYTNPKSCILGAEEAATTFRGLNPGGSNEVLWIYSPVGTARWAVIQMPRSGRSTSHLEVFVVSSVYWQY